MRHVSFDRALEKVGYGRFQRRLLWICGLGWAADAMEIMLVSFALPSMAADWSLSATEKGMLATAIFVGMFLGAIFWGRISDKIGRKFGFIATIAIDSIFGLLSAFSPNFIVFLVLRMCTGFGVGGTLPVDYAVFAEYLPAKDRGKRLVLLESFWALGTIAAAGLAWLVVPRFGWRVLFMVSAVPAILLFFIRKHVPESPRFLATSGRGEEALAVLRRVAGVNGTELDEDLAREVANSIATGVAGSEGSGAAAAKPKRWMATKALFSPDLRRTTILLWVIWYMISIGYYGTFTWLPSWLRSKGFPLPAVYPYSFFMALAQLPGYFSAAWFVEKIGRRVTLGVYLLGSGLCALAFAFAGTQVTVLIAALALSFFALGAWGALYAYTPEAYPTAIRTTGIGAASGMTRLAGMAAPFVGAMATGNSLIAALSIFAVAYALGGFSSFALPHETRNEELADRV